MNDHTQEKTNPSQSELQKAFFRRVFDYVDGFIELRRFPCMSKVWFESADDLISALPDELDYCRRTKKELFFGTCPRDKKESTKEHIAMGGVIWADMDLKDYVSRQDIESRYKNIYPFPDAVINSGGGGVHLYWFLNEAVPSAEIEQVNRMVRKVLDSDKAVIDSTRMMRVPGSLHRKDPERIRPCEIVHLNTNPDGHSIEDLIDIWPFVEKKPITRNQVIDYQPRNRFSPKIKELFKAHPLLRDLYAGRGKSGGGDTNSDYDWQLAKDLFYYGATEKEVCDCITKRRAEIGKKKKNLTKYVLRTVANAKAHQQRRGVLAFPGGEPTEPAQPEELGEFERCPTLWSQLQKKTKVTKDGEEIEYLIKNLSNLAKILKLDPRFKGLGKFNQFRNRYEWDWKDIGDNTITKLRIQISDIYGLEYKADAMRQAFEYVAKEQYYHPVKDQLNEVYQAKGGKDISITPDSLINNWLQKFCKADKSEITKTIGRKFLISAVARIMSPGCEVHSCLVLIGPQGIGKSTLFKLLAYSDHKTGKNWFRDSAIDIKGGRDAYSLLSGVWIYEFPELSSTRSKDAESVKAFLSSPVDSYRKSYARYEDDVKRQCVFVGSTNETEVLRDPTGARRFWTVETKENYDLAGLEAQRDQLWAEAVYLYNEAKERWHLDPEQGAKLQKKQVKFSSSDTWAQAIKDYSGWTGDGQTMKQIFESVLDIKPQYQNKAHQMRLATALMAAGWTKQLIDNEFKWAPIPPPKKKGES